jgi:acetamidase/formamidase
MNESVHGGGTVAATAETVAAEATLRATPDTVVWGYLAADTPPVLTVKSGQTVRIDTISQAGLTTADDPETFFGRGGIAPGEVLRDVVEIFHNVKRPKGASAHVLTGPIAVAEAAPRDMLEVRILALENRVPYGVNSSNRGIGVLPDLLDAPFAKIIRLDLARKVALFGDGIEVPLSPFMGIMAVAPPADLRMVSSRPPSRWGGNMDCKALTVGATLYLPVLNAGALFYTGDGHAVQGDGEIDGTAIEASLTATLQFIVHKDAGAAMRWPRAEDAAHHYVMGMDLDLDLAMRDAVQESVDFLRRARGLSAQDAYALTSIAVDFRVAEAVNATKVIYGAIPKRLFGQNAEYWHKR